jgi:hypothetical protein
MQPLAVFRGESPVFDPVLKRLADKYEPEFMEFLRTQLGLPNLGKVSVVQPNLPHRTIDVDRVYRISKPVPMLVHTEWESGSKLGRPKRFLVYNTLLADRTELPVLTVVLLLRKAARSSDLTGLFE